MMSNGGFRHVLFCLLAVPLLWLSAGAVSSAVAADEGNVQAADKDAPGADAETNSAGKRRTYLQTIMDGGLVGLLIIVLSAVSIGLIVLHSITIRRSLLMPEIDGLEEALHAKNVNRAVHLCESQEVPSLLGNVVLAGLLRYKNAEFGALEYRAAVEEAGEQETAKLYRLTDYLSLIGSVAPMLGLMGTVLGMIDAFNTIAVTGGMAKPDELAGGIGKALVTTLMGLMVAIPSMIAFSLFRSRIDSLVAETGNRVEKLLMPLGQMQFPTQGTPERPAVAQPIPPIAPQPKPRAGKVNVWQEGADSETH